MNKICFEKIRGMHLEITTKCNANCPMCSRNYRGKVRKDLKLAELTLSDCKKIFNVEFIKQLELISLCGVYGDPINATEIIEIINYFYDCNDKIIINLYTNGSMHSEAWWVELAKSLKNGYVVFGIDGIGDVNGIHRQNTDYEKIIRNALAFIAAGGKARWDYIVFKHNEHQVSEARKLSKNMGFSLFQVKKTSRFFKNLYEKDPELDSAILEYGKHPIFDLHGKIINYLELPEKKEYRNDSEKELFNLIKKCGSMTKYFDDVKIDCQAIKTGGIFVSALGDVYPCCTVYQQVCYGSLYDVKDEEELNEYKLSMNQNLSAFDSSIKDIVEGEFFTKLQCSWTLNSILEGKPKSCCRTCGEKLDMHKAQHTKKNDKRYQ